MKYEYNDKAIVLEHPCDEYKYLINPLSRNDLTELAEKIEAQKK